MTLKLKFMMVGYAGSTFMFITYPSGVVVVIAGVVVVGGGLQLTSGHTCTGGQVPGYSVIECTKPTMLSVWSSPWLPIIQIL